MDDKEALITELRQTIERLQQRVLELELALARAQKDSSNSSKPPSGDLIKPPKPKPKAGGKRKPPKQGGQPGHKRHLREPLPQDRVDEWITYELFDHEVLERGLIPTDEFETWQHIEFVESPIFVTEFRLRKYLTARGEMVLPVVEERDLPLFGPRMLSMIGWLKSRAHCSYTTIEAWFSDVLDLPVSRGYLAKLCNGLISDSLANSYEELKQAIPRQKQLGSDETGLKNNGKPHWIWCITAKWFSLYHIAPTRSRSVLEELIGAEFDGVLNCDYYSSNTSFVWNFSAKAQYCWAHLIRDIRFLLKHPQQKTKAWAEQLLDRTRRLFSAWHRRLELTQAGFEQSMTFHRDRFIDLIEQVPSSKEAQNLADRFGLVKLEEGRYYDLSDDYFRFLYEKGVEPTNNHTEQQVRFCVIDRLITQGTRSEVGQRYHERMWTAIATCAKQGRRFFDYLHQSLTAHLAGQPAPSLLPT
jgi:transposase